MKKMLLHTATTTLVRATLAVGLMSALPLIMSACSDDDDYALTEKDWDGTTTYFASTDQNGFSTYYKPYVGYAGDPMPFYDALTGSFKVLYLQNYLVNDTYCYHPIWAVETTDGGSYTSLGELISTGGEAEADAALGTGTTVYRESDGTYFTYYTGHTSSTEVVMRATSTDFVTWTKDRVFRLYGDDYGYSTTDFRDPTIFEDADGTYHMLISTQEDGKGTLAEFTSSNLEDWTHQGAFMTMMWDRFYECPDVFQMGNYWYLIYSEQHAAIRKVQYFKGTTLDELKACTADDAGLWPDDHEGFLDSRGLYAGKTASDGTNRYLWGWCPYRDGEDNTDVGAYPDEPEWSGNLVMHRIVQHDDGTLTLGEVSGISDTFTQTDELSLMASDGSISGSGNSYSLSGDSYLLFNRLNTHNKITFTVTTSGTTDNFGVSFVRGTDSSVYYSVIVNAESETTRKVNFEEEGDDGIGFVDGIDGYTFYTPSDNVYDVTIYTDNSVCVVYINDDVSYTNRIYGIQKNCWSINCYGGDIQVNDIQVSYY